MSTEQLQSGQGVAGLAEGGVSPRLGFNHAENVATGGGAMYLNHPEARGGNKPSGLGLEMGGGAGPVDEYFAKIGTASVDQINKFIEWAEQQNGAGVSRVNIGGVTVPLAEYRLRMEQALAMKQARPPERQQTGQPVDWKTGLQSDQRQRLQAFETKIAGLEPGQLQIVSNRLKELQAQALTDGWQSKEIIREDTEVCLRLIEEKLRGDVMSNGADQEFQKIVRSARVTGWRPSPDEFDPKIDLSGGSANGAMEKGR